MLLDFDVALVDGVARVHGFHCEHGLRGQYPGFQVKVPFDLATIPLVEDVPAHVRDLVTSAVHERVASTQDAGCDVDYFACSALVSADPPELDPTPASKIQRRESEPTPELKIVLQLSPPWYRRWPWLRMRRSGRARD
jgi:hypothetical protein